MYSCNELERLFLRYKLEGLPSGISIEQFRMSNIVPYNLFEKWYKDTRKKIISVQVLGIPSAAVDSVETFAPVWNQNPIGDSSVLPNTEFRILVDIRMNNGVHVSQKI